MIDDKLVSTGPLPYSGTHLYDVPFKFFTNDDLVVVIGNPDGSTKSTHLYPSGDFAVTGAGDANGGQVEIDPVAITYASGDTVTVYSNIKIQQAADARGVGPFHPNDDELIWDRMIRMVQQVYEEVRRAVKVGHASGVDVSTLILDDVANSVPIDDSAFSKGVVVGTNMQACLDSIDANAVLDVDTGWASLALDTNWASVSGDPVEYRKVGSIVHLRGNAYNDTLVNSVVATLPSGFRPPVTRAPVLCGVAVWKNPNTEETLPIQIDSDGLIVIPGSLGSVSTIANLTGVYFFVD